MSVFHTKYAVSASLAIVVGVQMESLSWILSQTEQTSLTRSIMRWMLFIDRWLITSRNIDAR